MFNISKTSFVIESIQYICSDIVTKLFYYLFKLNKNIHIAIIPDQPLTYILIIEEQMRRFSWNKLPKELLKILKLYILFKNYLKFICKIICIPIL